MTTSSGAPGIVAEAPDADGDDEVARGDDDERHEEHRKEEKHHVQLLSDLRTKSNSDQPRLDLGHSQKSRIVSRDQVVILSKGIDSFLIKNLIPWQESTLLPRNCRNESIYDSWESELTQYVVISESVHSLTNLAVESGPAVKGAIVVDRLHGEYEELGDGEEAGSRPCRAKEEGESAILKSETRQS